MDYRVLLLTGKKKLISLLTVNNLLDLLLEADSGILTISKYDLLSWFWIDSHTLGGIFYLKSKHLTQFFIFMSSNLIE